MVSVPIAMTINGWIYVEYSVKVRWMNLPLIANGMYCQTALPQECNMSALHCMYLHIFLGQSTLLGWCHCRAGPSWLPHDLASMQSVRTCVSRMSRKVASAKFSAAGVEIDASWLSSDDLAVALSVLLCLRHIGYISSMEPLITYKN